MSASITPSQIQYYEQHASDDRQPDMIATAVCGLIIAYVAVALRLWARYRSTVKFGIDDGLIISALIPLTGYAICAFLAVHFGEGKHIIFVTSPRSFIEEYVAAITSYSLCVMLTKLSILWFYNRIFPSQKLTIASWSIAVVVVAYNIALILVTALECIPLSTLWSGKKGKCINTLPPFTTLSVFNVVTDVVILMLPIRFVIRLNMRPVRKLQVCGIFLTGSVVCVFGIVRCVFIATASPEDQSYTAVPSGIWSNAEVAVGIVAACLPTLGILFSKSKPGSTQLGNSAYRRLMNNLHKWTERSSRRTQSDIGLSSLPKKQAWSELDDESQIRQPAMVHSFLKQGEYDIEQQRSSINRTVQEA